jgi:Rps23 Pro-64 3,4-dihydroxylase Tpa1-like proline 4-hydroxylase
MDGFFAQNHILPLVGPLGSNGAGPAAPITLLMRDGSRMSVDLADSWRQAPELAMALGPQSGAAGTITLELTDGSRLMLPVCEILGLHLPPEPAAARPMLTARVEAPPSPTDAEIHHVGQCRVMRICDFLPPEVAANLYCYALAKESDFQPSKVLSNDPEYRKSLVLFRFPEYEAMFRNALRAAFPPICEALGVPPFELADIECQLTATMDRGDFKPHNDNAAALGHRRITYVYYFHRQPRPFVGGDTRFFDHHPYAPNPPAVRHLVDIASLHNSVIFFDSGMFHEVRDIVCNQPGFETARFTINGWLSKAK